LSLALTGNWQLRTSPTALQLMRWGRRLAQGPLFRWRFSRFRPHELIAEPVDLHLSDPNLAHEFYYGRFALGGRVVQTGSISPFVVEPPTPQWEEALQNFSWLRHLDAAQTNLAAAQARSLLSDWINNTNRPMKGIAWRGDIVAQRIIAWLSHSRMLLDGAPRGFTKKFLKSLSFQTRYLRTVIHIMDDNQYRLQAHIALAFAAVCQTLPEKLKAKAIQQLEECLERQILPDGGHISRNPAILIDVLADLISLRHVFIHQGHTPPRGVMDAVERSFPSLRFFIHRDGSLARFNGVGPLLTERLAAILALDETAGHPFSHAPHSGYQRIASGKTIIIADTGYAPPPTAAHHAHAGCLSFEMSSGQHCFIINTGIDPYGADDLAFLGRTTAAHSTATINDTSSGRFLKQPFSNLVPLARSAHNVRVSQIEGNERNGFIASHDGYQKAFNLVHERGLVLNTNGKIIDGFDRFFSPGKEMPKTNGRDQIAIRFHLHPDIEVSFDSSGGLRLEALGGDVWSFTSPDVDIQLEDSIYFADISGPRKTRQIVLAVRPCLLQKIRWRFVQIVEA